MGKFNKFSGGGKGYERKYCRDSRDGLALTQVDQDLISTADADEFFNLQTPADSSRRFGYELSGSLTDEVISLLQPILVNQHCGNAGLSAQGIFWL